MGADFLFAHFIAPVERAEDLDLDFDAAREFIDSTDWNEHVEVIDQFDHRIRVNDNSEAARAKVNEVAREVLHHAVNNMRGFINRRDVGWLYRDGETVFLTGGMSWGDAPTELYRTFDLLGLSGLDGILLRKHAKVERAAGTNGITIHIP